MSLAALLEFTPGGILKTVKNSHVFLPFGKADNNASSVLSRACGKVLQLHP